MLPALTGYGYNEIAHRYYDASSGQFVAQSEIRDALESLIDTAALQMNNLSERLQNGTISLSQWQSGMMQQIKSANVAAGALANGGWGNMSNADWGSVGNYIRGQYEYLRNFSQEIANGTQPLDGRFLVRTDMYGDAPNTIYATMQTRSYTEQGYDEERRILEDKVSACDDCIDYAAEGWQPIGTLPEPGQDSVCMVRCRCEKVFRRSTDAESETE